MEYVGKTVKKEFEGCGIYSGVVKSFSSSTGFFVVEYENGDSEELGFSDVPLLLKDQDQPQQGEGTSYLDHNPQKRRRVDDHCEIDYASGNAGVGMMPDKANGDETLEADVEVNVVCINGLNGSFNLNDEVQKNQEIVQEIGGSLKENIEVNRQLNINVNLGDGLKNILERGRKCEDDFEGIGSSNGNLTSNRSSRDCLDLNAGSDSNEWLNLNDKNDLHASPGKNVDSNRRDSIDLNLYANGDFDENLTGGDASCSAVEVKKRPWDFDLNVVVNDDHVDTNNNGEGEITSFPIAEQGIDKIEDINMESIDEDPIRKEVQEVIIKELAKKIDASGGDVSVDASHRVSDLNHVDDGKFINIEVMDGFSEAGIQMIDSCQSEGQCEQLSGRRKRRKVLDGLNTPDTVLRRSTRRGSVQKTVSVASSEVSSPMVSVVNDENLLAYDCKGSDMADNLPVKLQLPPSSQNLNLDDIPIFDLFSVYACLRSFSTLLFLSPFELEEFLAALKSKSPTILFDYIHLAVLQTLRKHLEYLSTEGSESASCCLRSLNWNMLDLITWPIFMVEYLLIHGSISKPSADLCRLKLLKHDYYDLPTSVKIDVLRCLCDDMIEVEAIKSEINRRSLVAESVVIRDRSIKFEVYKKRKTSTDVSINSCLTEDILDDTTDWNSDECCLCKMDGSLICCDGCPAAYHLKCVGISHDLLPEGDWFCPECIIDRHKPWVKTQKSLRGAEVLGVDPHGRTYFSSNGYLLVADSCDTESSFSYYHRNELDVVIEALRSSYESYSDILVAIYKHWDIPSILNEKFSKPGSMNCIIRNYSDLCCEAAKSTNLAVETILESPTMNTEESALKTKPKSCIHNSQKHQANESSSVEFLNQDEIPCKLASGEDPSLTHYCLDEMQKSDTKSADFDHSSSMITEKENGPNFGKSDAFCNLYSFAQTASSVAEELMHKSTDKIKIKEMSEEEIIAAQMKVILKKTTNFCWSFIQNLNIPMQKEKCGWCFPCKSSSDDLDCLFKTNTGPVDEGLAVDLPCLQFKQKGKDHLRDVIFQILSIECRLQGLLLGPWLNSHYSKRWRESLLTFDLNCVKPLLLKLESNLHHLAISAEWYKYVDSVITLGSASLFMTSSLRATRHGISRKRARYADIESNASSNALSGLLMFWWRGGRLSRRMFNCKVLPRSLVSKAARQAGCTKIPGILYPEGSESAKRSRCIVWRAAVEASTSVEQLALQVRELYSNIRWDDIENTHPLPTLEKDSRKSIRLFKRVIVRRKCIEGGSVKYLLDFGKRRAVPDVVKKHGVMLDESSNERKRYWLSEIYVPLHLLKNFEEKRIARKSNEVKPKNAELGTVKSSQTKGFSYLFSKADRPVSYQCGHCDKVVPIREAVNCRYCQGFFHKRHVKKFVESIAAICTYTCHRCWNGISVKTDAKRGKSGVKGGKLPMKTRKKVSTDARLVRLKNRKRLLKAGKQVQTQKNAKVSTGIPLRRSARQAKYSALQKKKQDKKVGGGVKRKRTKSRKGTPKKCQRDASLHQKRTLMHGSFWLNGLRLSRKPDDERVMRFREKNLITLPQDITVNLDKPKCILCSETGHASLLNYIACEICGEWFHGDAFGLDLTKINQLIGFRCHICRNRMPPVCPHRMNQETDVLELPERDKCTILDEEEEN